MKRESGVNRLARSLLTHTRTVSLSRPSLLRSRRSQNCRADDAPTAGWHEDGRRSCSRLGNDDRLAAIGGAGSAVGGSSGPEGT